MHNEETKLKLDRRTFIKGTAVVGASALAASALSGCVGGGGGSSRGGTVRYYINQPACIDPFDLQESEGTAVSANLFDSLTKFDYRTQELIPAAAESWEISDDATVFTFKLREGATFHNGDPVTAADFKFSWERTCNPATTDEPSVISYHIDKVVGYDDMLEGKVTELEGLKALDELTFEVTLVEPFADFIYVASHPALGPVPSGGAADDFATFSRAPIGNGPFMMDGVWEDDQYIRTKRFDGYHGKVPNVDGCDFMIFESPETAFLEFQAGNLDLSMISTGQIESTKETYGNSVDGYTSNPGAQTLMGAESSTYYFIMNHKDELFSNKDIRKAVSMAVNRQAICDTIFEGTRIPGTGIVPPGIDGHRPDAWPYAKYDVEAAKQALADAGYPGGAGLPTIKLSCNSGGGHEEIMQMVQADLEAIGVKAELDTMEWATYLTALQNGEYQLGRLGWIADYPIMDNFLYPLFYTDTGDNRSQYSNKDVDEKIIEARSITDDAARIKLYQEVDDILGEDAVVAPVMFYCHHDVCSEKVQNFFFGPNRVAALSDVEIV
ncbi:MAG: ABC transporter substrate-binding protein [Eggerthellaceae bacterium]|nr:ABC transporter substrate-binding protein [Eggerthellaceae bacterium]